VEVADVLPVQQGTHVLSEVVTSHILPCVTGGGGCAGSDPWDREVREAGRQGGEDGMTVQIPVAHEHQKESSNSLLFSNPSRGTSKQTADIDAHIEVPSTPSTMERIMSQPSSSPDCLRLFPPVASCEPQAHKQRIDGDGGLVFPFGHSLRNISRGVLILLLFFNVAQALAVLYNLLESIVPNLPSRR
jgi:hypothetical protein